MTIEREKELNTLINERLKRLSRIKREIKNPEPEMQCRIMELDMEINAIIDRLIDEKEEGAG